MTLRLHDTLTDSTEPFEPLADDGTVRLFVCGVTEYDALHLGHVRTFVVYDVLRRYLERAGYDVFYVQNVTDVGHLADDGVDKVQKAASEGAWPHPKAVAEHYEAEHHRLNDELRVRRPDLMPRASGHVPEILAHVEELLEAGYAYEADGSVYFRVRAFEDYGKLSNVDPAALAPGARVDPDPAKEHPADFALWRAAGADQPMTWDSPWGPGYPGWHIEDTAIARRYLGDRYDVHGGAVELAFPHHEAEIAQAEAATGVAPYVNYWVHAGLVTVDGEKMSKSTGNFVTAAEALADHPPEALRLWALSARYRSPVDYEAEALDAASERVRRLGALRDRLERAGDPPVPDGDDALRAAADRAVDAVEAALADDLNTREALAAAFDLVADANRALDRGEYSAAGVAAAREALGTVDDLFGVVPPERETPGAVAPVVDAAVEVRESLRERGEYALADEVRDALGAGRRRR